ncbi:MAG: amidohydrolase family protein, partial [Vicinamibacteria bacterium]
MHLSVILLSLVIENVTLIDGTGRSPLPGVTIVIEEDRFRSIEKAADAGAVSGPRIDGTGKWAIPGLMDMHVHLRGGVRALHGYLYSGVTSIYDAGNDPEVIFALREKERSGEILAPRIFATGAIVTAPGGHGGQGAVTIEDFVRDRPKLDEHIAREPDVLKITQDEHGWGTRPMIRHMSVDLLEEVVRYYHQ